MRPLIRPCPGVPLVAAAMTLAAFLASCSAPVRLQRTTDVTLIHPAAGVNSAADDLAPLASEGWLLFTSTRPVRGGGDGTAHLYRAAFDSSGFAAPSVLTSDGATPLAGGTAAFLRGPDHILFASCFNPDGIGDCDLYAADLAASRLGSVRNLGPAVNSIEWDSQPTVTADGQTAYFASERRGGAGGSDIWRTTRAADGTWSAPVNLGAPVNTSGDEKTPFISPDGTTLYFSSDRRPGAGGFDIFRSQKTGAGWGVPVLLGSPYNSSGDDLFYSTNARGDTSWFASDRQGSLGGFDIWEVVPARIAPPQPRQPKSEPLIVRYTARNAFTLQPIAATITLSRDTADDVQLHARSDGIVQHDITPGIEYTATGTCPGFMSAVESFYYPPNTGGRQDRVLLLTPVTETERKIYAFVVEFDFNLSNIRPAERKHLDSVVTLLEQYPKSRVIVSGHTDSVGTEMYNIRLGYSRAKEVSGYVEKYLLARIASLRHPIEIRTYGKTQPIASNSTEEGRQRNRRVEIAIVRDE